MMNDLAFSIGNVNVYVPNGIPSGGLTSGNVSLAHIITTGIAFLLVLATIIALLYLILGGLKWITSGGDASKLAAARQQIIYAAIGLAIAFAAFLIVGVIGNALGAKLFS